VDRRGITHRPLACIVLQWRYPAGSHGDVTGQGRRPEADAKHERTLEGGRRSTLQSPHAPKRGFHTVQCGGLFGLNTDDCPFPSLFRSRRYWSRGSSSQRTW
jgi:hypothetical protein